MQEKAEKIYEQVQKIKDAEAELDRLLGVSPKRGRPPKEDKDETRLEASQGG